MEHENESPGYNLSTMAENVMFMAGMNVDTMPYFDFYRSMMKYCWQIGRKIVNLLFQFLIIGIENESFMSK